MADPQGTKESTTTTPAPVTPSPSAPVSPSETDDSGNEIRNPNKLLSAFERQKEENKALKATLSDVTGKMNTIESILGKLDANQAEQIKAQVEAAERAKREAEEARKQIAAEAEEAVKAAFQPQIQTLEQNNLSLSSQNQYLLERQALSDAFHANNGLDYAAFSMLYQTKIKPEFTTVPDPANPNFQLHKLKRFVNIDGSPVTDAQGVELSVSQVFQKANSGGFGNPLKSTFADFNQSSGDGFFQTDQGSDTENPWSKKHFNLTKQGQITKQNPALARQMQAQARSMG